MPQKLTDKGVLGLATPTEGRRIVFDTLVPGFGVVVRPTGSRTFVFNCRVHGRERRTRIGSPPVWNVTQARKRAIELRRDVDFSGGQFVESVNSRDRIKDDGLSRGCHDGEQLPLAQSVTTTTYWEEPNLEGLPPEYKEWLEGVQNLKRKMEKWEEAEIDVSRILCKSRLPNVPFDTSTKTIGNIVFRYDIHKLYYKHQKPY